VLEEERKEQRQKILDNLNPGDVVEGQISNIVDFGAFVDLDGMDGLIHISELSWSHVNHPSEVLEIGQTVEVKVLDIDRERQRISLGLKQTQSDPWQQVVDTYSEGDVVDGKVTKVVTFGAFVEILAGVEGLVHISELANHHVENPREVVAQGDDVKVLILEIDGERRRLSLSLKRVDGGGHAISEEDAAHLTGHIELPAEYASAAPSVADDEAGEVDDITENTAVEAESSEDAAEGDAETVDEDLAEAAPAVEAEAEVAEPETEAAPEPEAAADVEADAEAEPAAATEPEPSDS
jgi:small subunit ribosomal protein S1